MVPRETVSFVFRKVLMVPETKSRETLGLEGKRNELVSRGTTHYVLCFIFRLSLKQSYSNNKKTKTAERLYSQSSILLNE